MAHPLPSQLLSTCSDGVLYCFSKYVYTASNGVFWWMMLLGFCAAIFMATKRFGTNRAFGFGSFVGMAGAFFFLTLQLISWEIASAFIIVGAIGIAVMVMSER